MSRPWQGRRRPSLGRCFVAVGHENRVRARSARARFDRECSAIRLEHEFLTYKKFRYAAIDSTDQDSGISMHDHEHAAAISFMCDPGTGATYSPARFP